VGGCRQVYETINKHFQEYTTSVDAMDDLQEEIRQLEQTIGTLKAKAQVCLPSRVRMHGS
jgi:hypothetical protein